MMMMTVTKRMMSYRKGKRKRILKRLSKGRERREGRGKHNRITDAILYDFIYLIVNKPLYVILSVHWFCTCYHLHLASTFSSHLICLAATSS